MEKTWEELVERSLHDPVLYAVLSMHRLGQLTREEALIAATLALSKGLELARDELLEHKNLCICRSYSSIRE